MFEAFDVSKYDLSTQDQAKKEQICNDFKNKIQTMNLSKYKARSMLLGEQWFLGRTGFVAPDTEDGPDENEGGFNQDQGGDGNQQIKS